MLQQVVTNAKVIAHESARLIKVWHSTKILKYETMLASMEELRDKFDTTPGQLTLTELVQYEYMGKEVLMLGAIAQQLASRADDEPESPNQGVKDIGLYM